jgi:hypothetical protein
MDPVEKWLGIMVKGFLVLCVLLIAAGAVIEAMR